MELQLIDKAEAIVKKYENELLEKGIKCEVFRKYVEKGTVKFVEDCPIEDSKLREILKKDYIPAGEYPIYLEENDYVILLSK